MHVHQLTQPSFVRRLPRARTVVLWVLQVGLATMFFIGGITKLAAPPEMVALFDMLGLGQWFRIFTGIVEYTAAAMLLVPAVSGIGAALVIPTMLGAIATHLFVIGGSSLLPILLLVAAAVVLVGRWERTLGLLRR